MLRKLKSVALFVAVSGAIFGLTVGKNAEALVPGVNTLVSVNNTGDGQGGNGDSPAVTSGYEKMNISANGRYAVFNSLASNLVPNDTNGTVDVFVRDLVSNTTTRANVSTAGTQASGAAIHGGQQQAISSTGRYVAFISNATNLIDGQTITTQQIYMRDMVSHTTTIVTQKSDGTLGNGSIAELAGVSSDGRFVAWNGGVNTNLHPESSPIIGTGMYVADLKDRTFKQLEPGMLWSDGVTYNRRATNPTMSCDGSFVAFQTFTPISSGDTDTKEDVYIFDLRNGDVSTVNASYSSTSNTSGAVLPELSCNGDFLTFRSADDDYSPLVTTTSTDHVYLYDRILNEVSLVDTSSSGALNNSSSSSSAVDDKGNVVFTSGGSNLVTGSTITYPQVYLKHREGGLTEFVTKAANGNPTTGAVSAGISISADGKAVCYITLSPSDLISSDTNGKKDVIVSQTGL